MIEEQRYRRQKDDTIAPRDVSKKKFIQNTLIILIHLTDNPHHALQKKKKILQSTVHRLKGIHR